MQPNCPSPPSPSFDNTEAPGISLGICLLKGKLYQMLVMLTTFEFS